MFEEILQLPAHPLIVHAAVVLVPLLAVVAAVYAVLPGVRTKLEWAVVGLAVAAPAVVYAARESGEAFEHRLAARDMLPPPMAASVEKHGQLATRLFWFVLALAVVALLLVAVQVAVRRAAAHEITGTGESAGRRGLWLAVTVLLAVAIIGLGAGSGWYVFQTGHSGAEMVWEGQ